MKMLSQGHSAQRHMFAMWSDKSVNVDPALGDLEDLVRFHSTLNLLMYKQNTSFASDYMAKT